LRLTDEDPSIFAKCPRCDKRGMGTVYGRQVGMTFNATLSYYGKAFNVRQWRRGPVCENCGTGLVEVRRITLEG
jgi:hypothetical protein